jgi:Fe-S oxidoreductase
MYVDEVDTRLELARMIDVCGNCRRCTDICGSFDILFRSLEVRGQGDLFVPLEQDRIVLSCVQCGRCTDGCPHLAGAGSVNVPATLRRGLAMLRTTGQLRLRDRARLFLMRRRGAVSG